MNSTSNKPKNKSSNKPKNSSFSPFELFRRNLKSMMVLLTGLAVFAFVALPVLDQYMRNNAGASGNTVVASFSGRELSRGRVDYFTRNHQSTVRFLMELAEETIARGGFPSVSGFDFDDQNQRVISVGISQQPSFMGSIRSLMLASLAQEDGFELDDTSLQVWLDRFTDGKINDRDIVGMLARATKNRMGRQHLYEQLRTHLLAKLYEERGLAGIIDGQPPMAMPLMTPQQTWENFLKLKQSAIVSAYGIRVDDFLPETDAKPAESEIQKVYDEGKDRDPNELSPDPGFHQRYTAKIEYVSADLQTFIDQDVAKLKEEEIRAEYERRIKGGDFLVPSVPEASLPEITPPENGSDSSPDEAAETPEAEAGNDGEPAAKDAADAPDASATASDTPAANNENGEAVTGDEPSTEVDGAEQTAEPPSVDQPNEPTAPAVEDQSLSKPSSANTHSNENAVRLVSLSQEAVVDTQASDSKQAEAETAGAGDNGEDDPSTEADSSDSDTPDEPAVDGEAAAEADGETEQTTADEQAVETFETVRDQVAADMVRSAAQERMFAVLEDIKNQMRRYFGQNNMYQNSLSIQGNTGVKAPARPDLAKIAEEFGIQHELLDYHDVVSISDEPISQSVAMGTGQRMGQSSSFVQLAYGSSSAQSTEPTLPLFSPTDTTDPRTMRRYLAWKTEETKARTPELSEVRDEVVMAIRIKEARNLAVKFAQSLADKAKGSESTELREIIAEDKLDALREGLGPFTWMQSFNFQGVSISAVPGIEAAGKEFMKAVFTNEPGTISVAVDQPGNTVYLIQADQFQPEMTELQEQFKQTTNRFESMMIGNGGNEIIVDYFDRLDEKSQFKDLTKLDE